MVFVLDANHTQEGQEKIAIPLGISSSVKSQIFKRLGLCSSGGVNTRQAKMFLKNVRVLPFLDFSAALYFATWFLPHLLVL